jgi:hypothetical protein
MMTRTTRAFALTTLLCSFAACGGDDDDSQSGGGSAARMSCDRQCEAQERVQGCRPLLPLAQCKQLCAAIVADIKPECGDEFSAYYDCSANQGFECGGIGTTQDAAPCKSALDALDACEGPVMCVGARDSGTCPSVVCPCPSGATNVSGFSNEGGECRCYDEKTCLDFFCD